VVVARGGEPLPEAKPGKESENKKKNGKKKND